ncbi:zinc finger CW-type PWWP domain protein 2 isoform X2 [Rhineura floridana]|uniref:zinc finger CW-type PWWP domain protein 2 isoform X2 n=1 Tax=Rhineura floridana TaxID=261503 RepID=UPI002AC86DBC|nr:zinc finger CW-type PWWP domain protein 2 isoform X2 [Rhineura floridana]
MDSVSDNFYLDKVWVQCENSSCLKWRLLQHDDTTHIDRNAPWYCYMNPDPWFNKCSVSEEHFPEESQFQKHGLKYVYSKLPLGSLVLVKMHTWPRWPGILCPDPVTGEYVTYDLDGDVESHHVEFLGKPHSKSWAAIKSITYYPSSFKLFPCALWRHEGGSGESDSAGGQGGVEGRSSRIEVKSCGDVIKNKEAKTKTKSDMITCNKTEKNWTKSCGGGSSCRTGRKKKRRMFTSSLEIAGSEDPLSNENLVVSETEIILKDLDQIIKHIAAPSSPSFASFVDGENNHVREEVANCCLQLTEKRPMEISTQEDCIIIDGKAFKAGECIESITDRFKEIDSLMAEFQDSL